MAARLLSLSIALLALATACAERVDAPLKVEGGAGASMVWEACGTFGGQPNLDVDSSDPWLRRYASGGFVKIGGVDASSSEVWVADLGVSRVQAFDYSGGFVRALGSGVIADGTILNDVDLFDDYTHNAMKRSSWQYSDAGLRWAGNRTDLFLAADVEVCATGLWIADWARTAIGEKSMRTPAVSFIGFDGVGRQIANAPHAWPGYVAEDKGMVAASEKLCNYVKMYASTPEKDGLSRLVYESNGTMTRVAKTLMEETDNVRFYEILDRQVSASSAPGEFRYPGGIAIAFDKLLVCDTGNKRIQVFEARNIDAYFWGKLIKIIDPVAKNGARRFSEPTDIDVSDDGTMFILDAERNEVAVLDPSFRRIGVVGSGDFGSPYSVACSPDGRHCFVSDRSGNKVWHYARTN